jgi:hypothetical protein
LLVIVSVPVKIWDALKGYQNGFQAWPFIGYVSSDDLLGLKENDDRSATEAITQPVVAGQDTNMTTKRQALMWSARGYETCTEKCEI